MATATIAAVGLAAGLHGALYGAYKDSPHESFLLRRFVREIAIALTVALGLALLHESASGESLFVLYVSIFALTRTATEFWKLFGPFIGAVGGVIASGHTSDPAFLLLAAIGSMRMLLELLFKMLVRDYVPGKFMSLTGPYLQWAARRRYFVVPYAVTWLLYVALCSHADW
jgi:hypothetical protein